MPIVRMPALWLAALLCCAPVFAATDPDALAQALDRVNQRLDQLEQQNRQLNERVEELTRQNQSLRAGAQSPAVTSSSVPVQVAPAAVSAAAPREEWESRIRLGGDFRFRHEQIDNEAAAHERPRESVRAHLNAAIKISDDIKGEVGIGSGGRDPRGGSSTLGEASSRKEIGLDLAYMSWRATEQLTLTAGKMREPYVRPGRSQFIDNEIRPEGIAFNYRDKHGIFGNAFNFWLEERSAAPDSMLRGGQVGWDGALGTTALKAGVGYYDYHNVQGRNPNFGGGVVNQFGNTLLGSGANAVFAYDYDIGQLFAELTVPMAGIPLNFYADYGHNFEAQNGLDSACSFGVLVGKASAPGRWEAGVLTQRVEKDALFGQWTDSDFGSGITDNDGYVWRVAWMAMKNVLINATYYDTQYNVDVGSETDYDRWQLDFNFNF